MKVRTALLLNISNGWLGGVNYYKNLLTAVTAFGKGDVEPLIVLPRNADKALFKDYPTNIELHETSLLERWSLLWIFRRVVQRILDKDYILSIYLRFHGVKMISHLQTDERYPWLKTAAWITDFQHKHCPEFFSDKEIKERDQVFFKQAKNSDVVILSSYDAKKDFVQYFPKYADKAEVLQFVPSLELSESFAVGKVLKKYSLPDKFFYVPNQYWVHKNHMVILKALKILKDHGRSDIVVVSTGNASDYRAPGYFDEIETYVAENGLADHYKILGLIPYADVQALAMQCHAYINPSLFEGWSTTVEEAKYRGKCIILSDLGVHKEQTPRYGVFFNPKDPVELSEKMLSVWDAPRVQEREDELVKMSETMKRRFAQRFEEIVERTMKK